jgi:hypothetical protein
MTQRFEAVFHEEEPNERSAVWHVVEWTYVSADGKSKHGSKVKAFPDTIIGEEMARELAYVLNREHAFGEYA